MDIEQRQEGGIDTEFLKSRKVHFSSIVFGFLCFDTDLNFFSGSTFVIFTSTLPALKFNQLLFRLLNQTRECLYVLVIKYCFSFVYLVDKFLNLETILSVRCQKIKKTAEYHKNNSVGRPGKI